MERNDVIEYLAGLEHRDRFILDREVSALRSKIDNRVYLKNNEKYKKKVERDRIRGEEMMKVIKPGMVVKCSGTKDGLGIREVLETSDSGITARKILQTRRTHSTAVSQLSIRYYRDGYITAHGWNKVKKILNIEIDE